MCSSSVCIHKQSCKRRIEYAALQGLTMSTSPWGAAALSVPIAPRRRLPAEQLWQPPVMGVECATQQSSRGWCSSCRPLSAYLIRLRAVSRRAPSPDVPSPKGADGCCSTLSSARSAFLFLHPPFPSAKPRREVGHPSASPEAQKTPEFRRTWMKYDQIMAVTGEISRSMLLPVSSWTGAASSAPLRSE